MWFESLFVFTFYSNLKHIPTFQEFRLYKKVRKRWSLPLTEWLFLEPKMVLLRHRSEESFKHLYFSECIVSIAVTHMCKNSLVAVLRGHENVSFACVFKICGLKKEILSHFEYCQRGSCRWRRCSWCAGVLSYFCCFLGLERLNTCTCMCQNARLCKYPCKHSNLVLNWKQTAEEENMCLTVGSGHLLKGQQSNIPAVCHSC